ncbi:cyclin-like protein interacting with PHO85 [Coemansia brasiliensis]|uniref:Cyclin-like protein interacting with PHO85 n=1 Tax=Coemansia brasiliensis TaxID=2650707 RepID=A0A9W8LXJ8_9FUNG|nr:cyclin-like protein interacting with PHO85 [Coemansia brasiliensis]
MFDIAHTSVSVTIAHMAELIDAVAAANHQALGAISKDITPFHSRTVPSISIHDYLERVAKFVCLENDSLLAVLVYLDRITRAQLHRPSLALSPFNIHRLAITAITIAHKFNSDIFFNNARYSKVGGIPLGELNQLELEMLFLVKFDLKVDMAELQQVGEWLVTRSRLRLSGHPPLCLLSRYYEDSARHQQLPTPSLDPNSGSAHGTVPQLELAPYILHAPSDSYYEKPPLHSTHVTRPTSTKQSAGGGAELTTPSSLNTLCHPPSSPQTHNDMALADADDQSRVHLQGQRPRVRLSSDSSCMAFPSSPNHPLASESTLVQKRRKLRTSDIYPPHASHAVMHNVGCNTDSEYN